MEPEHLEAYVMLAKLGARIRFEVVKVDAGERLA